MAEPLHTYASPHAQEERAGHELCEKVGRSMSEHGVFIPMPCGMHPGVLMIGNTFGVPA